MSETIPDQNQEKISRLNRLYESMSLRINNLILNDEKNKQEINDLKDLIININNNIDYITKSCDSFCRVDELKLMKNDFKNYKEEMNQTVINYSEKLKDCLEKQNEIYEKNRIFISNLKKEQDLRYSEDVKIKNDLNRLEESLKNEVKNQKLNIKDLSYDLIETINDKINAIPKPFIPSLDEAKAVMQQQLEPVVLDAKNANIRSTNTDMKVHVLEKKIEQFKLVIEQFNLQA